MALDGAIRTMGSARLVVSSVGVGVGEARS